MILIIIILTAIYLSIGWMGKFLYPIKYREQISAYSQKYNIDPFLVISIMRIESKYNKDALSHKGARGLMQISPITGEWGASEIGILEYREDLLFEPDINIEIGCWYLNKLKCQFNNNLELMLAAYNGGSGNVTKWLRDERYSENGQSLKHIPFKETEVYIKKVLKSYDIYRKLYNTNAFES